MVENLLVGTAGLIYYFLEFHEKILQVMRKNKDNVVKKVSNMIVDSYKSRGRLNKLWINY